ncbi:hypothetical protein HJC23_003480 [Cyclotella cryptica]|uniref:Ankyrin n=1 Tax=Cyclotella cryptica TaxID=29204 RepID=A0ABD3QYL9_9STRA|eukprot:CCRYP_002630-RA/>CCRYP_002630-RA protein AED:0.20 eAED:-0.33 QI:0/-1/0/1/-1/1/1/0/383
MTTSTSSRRSCPCQHISLSLSSATAAEYGDTASLSRRLHKIRNNDLHQQQPSSTISNGGITPLHLAAQHDHPAAVLLLLTDGNCHVDTGLVNEDVSSSSFCGATPLHRASFAGAVSAMRILLDWGTHDNQGGIQTDILARDSSFGDLRTPLHKAVAGGRPMAVQLLLMVLSQRKLLERGLEAVDSQGLTPLELVKQYTSLSSEDLEREKSSVRRWDAIAGGCADWESCQTLLDDATSSIQNLTIHIDLPEMSPLNFMTTNHSSLLCGNENVCQDETCRTAAWENAFRTALASSMQTSLGISCRPFSRVPLTKHANRDEETLRDVVPPTKESKRLPNSSPSYANDDERRKPFGRACDLCRMQSSALFRSANGFVCKQCRRSILS